MIAGTVLGEQSQSPGDVARVVTDLVSFTFPFSNKPLSFLGVATLRWTDSIWRCALLGRIRSHSSQPLWPPQISRAENLARWDPHQSCFSSIFRSLRAHYFPYLSFDFDSLVMQRSALFIILFSIFALCQYLLSTRYLLTWTDRDHFSHYSLCRARKSIARAASPGSEGTCC